MTSSESQSIAVAVVRHEGRVLIGQRPEGVPLAGLWEFPGGKVRPGETPSEAAARECAEETHLAVCVGELLAEVVHEYAHGRVRLHFFTAAPVDVQQMPATPFCWVATSELSDYQFPEANRTVIERLTKA